MRLLTDTNPRARNAFYRYLKNSNDTSFVQGFAYLQALLDSGVQLALLWDFDNKNAGQVSLWSDWPPRMKSSCPLSFWPNSAQDSFAEPWRVAMKPR
ncbi:MAG: hypothetical protein BWK77_08220 [Verrucomicrobia bacterium A1]|nr:MAG: hypothetical protein BWK77_08220 [Verrucomicrobia bacterium A1]